MYNVFVVVVRSDFELFDVGHTVPSSGPGLLLTKLEGIDYTSLNASC